MLRFRLLLKKQFDVGVLNEAYLIIFEHKFTEIAFNLLFLTLVEWSSNTE